MADRTTCSACKSAPKLHGRKCAFRGPKFSADNWMCETLGRLRDAAIFRNRDDLHSGSIAVVLLPDVERPPGLPRAHLLQGPRLGGRGDSRARRIARSPCRAARLRLRVAALARPRLPARPSVAKSWFNAGTAGVTGASRPRGFPLCSAPSARRSGSPRWPWRPRLSLGATNMANRLAELRSLGLVERRGAGAPALALPLAEAPVRCVPVDLTLESGEVVRATVCGARAPRVRCTNCQELVQDALLCDGRGADGTTCDRALCRGCAVKVDKEDLCPEHSAARAIAGVRVQTARMGYRGESWLDITRGGNEKRQEEGGHLGIGLAFAPSAQLLKPYLERRRRRGRVTAEEWAAYTQAYTIEMRASYRRARPAWDRLLGMKRVVLLCFCPQVCRCHRLLLARDILPKLGAVYAGEVRS